MIKKLLIVIVLCSIIGAAIGVYIWNKPSKRVEEEKGISVTAISVSKLFTDDKTKAATLYLNKALEISGEVTDININQDGNKMVLLKTGDSTKEIRCTMREKDATIAKGQSVTIKGYCSGYLESDIPESLPSSIVLTDCVLKK